MANKLPDYTLEFLYEEHCDALLLETNTLDKIIKEVKEIEKKGFTCNQALKIYEIGKNEEFKATFLLAARAILKEYDKIIFRNKL